MMTQGKLFYLLLVAVLEQVVELSPIVVAQAEEVGQAQKAMKRQTLLAVVHQIQICKAHLLEYVQVEAVLGVAQLRPLELVQNLAERAAVVVTV